MEAALEATELDWGCNSGQVEGEGQESTGVNAKMNSLQALLEGEEQNWYKLENVCLQFGGQGDEKKVTRG